MLLSESLENYLEAIYVLLREKQVARSKDIAERLKVTRPSVTGALQTLAERQLVHYEPYGYVTLTAEGEQAARRVVHRHRVLKDFLVTVLGIDEAEAEASACKMEHAVSKQIMERLVDFAEFVKACPRAEQQWLKGFKPGKTAARGAVCKACMKQAADDVKNTNKDKREHMTTTTLNELKPGDRAKIARLAGGTGARRRMADMGMTKGSPVEVIRVAPLGDPIDVKIRGYHLSLRKEEASAIEVEDIRRKNEA